MRHRIPEESVMRAYFKLLLLAHSVRETRQIYEPNLDGFSSFDGEIKLIHRAILVLLQTINAPLQQFEALGLKTTTTSWLSPPLNCIVAMQDIGRMMRAMETLINIRNGSLNIPDYDRLEHEIDYALDSLEEFNEQHDPRSDISSSEEDSEEDPNVVPGATDEQINAMPVHTATSEVVDQECSICLSNFVVGEPTKILNCCHRFHKNCIDNWLKNCAICPMDRSRVFTN